MVAVGGMTRAAWTRGRGRSRPGLQGGGGVSQDTCSRRHTSCRKRPRQKSSGAPLAAQRLLLVRRCRLLARARISASRSTSSGARRRARWSRPQSARSRAQMPPHERPGLKGATRSAPIRSAFATRRAPQAGRCDALTMLCRAPRGLGSWGTVSKSHPRGSGRKPKITAKGMRFSAEVASLATRTFSVALRGHSLARTRLPPSRRGGSTRGATSSALSSAVRGAIASANSSVP